MSDLERDLRHEVTAALSKLRAHGQLEWFFSQPQNHNARHNPGSKGLPDIWVFKGGKAIGLELKADAGKLSAEQEARFKLFKKVGINVHEVKTMADFWGAIG